MNEIKTARFNAVDFLVRLAFALALVVLTYNPTRFSFAHWVSAAFGEGTLGPLHFLAGVVLLIGWVIFVRTTWESIGALGLLLAAAFFAGMVWLLVDVDLLRMQSLAAVIWVVLICVAIVLAVGMSWGHMQKRASGQVDVDDVDH
jgi:hypothetical protein